MRFKASLAYDGTNYLGFQKLTHKQRSVLGAVEAALTKLSGTPIKVLGAGRTDAGVHATGQVIAFDLPTWRHSEDSLLQAINATLPTDIAVWRVERTEPGFHPRFDALSRTYCYAVYTAPARQPLLARTHWHIRQPAGKRLDIDKMNVAAAQLVGSHDFASFGRPPERSRRERSTVRQVFRSEWSEQPYQGGRIWQYTIEANAFLYHMVRCIVHALVEVGAHRLTLDAFTDAFQARDRSRFVKLAPAHGLTLITVTYDESGTTPAGEKQDEN